MEDINFLKCQISIEFGDILRATEGELSPVFCLTEEGECERKENCKTHLFWKGLDNTISEYIDSKTLEDLVK